MTAQLVSHIERHGMMEAHQSAYNSSHSTKTALLKVKTDIIQALDNQEVACLILLNLSAAFDTIDHDILLNRLKSRFAVTGVVLKWLMSYLKDKSQSVEIGVPLSGGSRSEYAKIGLGIPQGSVLGPILFTILQFPLAIYAESIRLHFTFMQMTPKFTYHLGPAYHPPNMNVLQRSRKA